MEVSSVTIAVVMPLLLACSVYYSHYLRQQLVDCESTKSSKSDPAMEEEQRELHSGRRLKDYFRERGTSAWCKGTSNVNRRCVFHNLCYHPKLGDYIFLHGPHSLREGVLLEDRQPALADLSSVSNHNGQYFDYVDVQSLFVDSFENVTYLPGRFLLFNRFNPGNLMHIFHDDLLPVFHTLLQLGLLDMEADVRHATLITNDDHDRQEHFHLYEHLSCKSPMRVQDLRRDGDDLVCFQEVHVGLSKLTTWYQYGFDTPQAALDEIRVSAREIHLFTSYYKSKLGVVDCPSDIQHKDLKDTFIILSRRMNRLILNEVDLSLALARRFNALVIVASLATHSLSELIQLISCSKGLIAVHGSLLSLAIFLPPKSVLLEIFPYGVNPNNYTPYRTLSSLEGMRITYRSWRNLDKRNTVTHPDAEAEFGGLGHLDPEERDRILSGEEVPLHLCCSDAEWLFRIYQDTIVDVESFLMAMAEALGESSSGEAVESDWIASWPLRPGGVTGTSCSKIPIPPSERRFNDDDSDEVGILLSWQPPWNLHFLLADEGDASSHVKYEVTIQEQGQGELYAGAFILAATSHTFQEGFRRDHVYYAWIRCSVNDKIGPYVAIVSCPFIPNSN